MSTSRESAAEPRHYVRCRQCLARTELIVSMTSPTNGRKLSIFRCECGKLTSTDRDALEHVQGGLSPSTGLRYRKSVADL